MIDLTNIYLLEIKPKNLRKYKKIGYENNCD